MKNEALRELVALMKQKTAQQGNPVNKTIVQHLSDSFSEKERDKQKMNKMIFSQEDNNITR